VTSAQLEQLICQAVACGIIKDARPLMPRGKGHWSKRNLSDVVGVCLHQNGANNFDDPIQTATYHVGPNHVTSEGWPSTAYDFMIPDIDEPAWLVSEMTDRKAAQGDPETPGSENEFLLGILVMGNYDGPGHRGSRPEPSRRQLKHLEMLISWLQHIFGFGDEGLFGHFNFSKPGCPGFALMAYIEHKRMGCEDLITDEQWQRALLGLDPLCLPKWGADGDWGAESQKALISFQKKVRFSPRGFKDPFTELLLLRALRNAGADLSFLLLESEQPNV